jgi:hypothetical protein
VDFLKLVANSVSFIQQNGAQIVAGFFAVVAAATLLIKALQSFVDLFPKHQTADTAFGAILRVLADISHSKFLNSIAFTPSAPHSFMVGKRMSAVSKNFGGAAQGFARLGTLLVLLVVTTVLSACAAFNGLVQQTVSCDAQNVVSAIPGVIGSVIDAIQGGDDWNAKLTAIATTQGVELVACALQKAIAMLGSNSSMVSTAASVPNSVAISRATAWVAAHTK